MNRCLYFCLLQFTWVESKIKFKILTWQWHKELHLIIAHKFINKRFSWIFSYQFYFRQCHIGLLILQQYAEYYPNTAQSAISIDYKQTVCARCPGLNRIGYQPLSKLKAHAVLVKQTVSKAQ